MTNATYAIARIIKRADDIALTDIQAQGLHILQARRLCDDLNQDARVSDPMAGNAYTIVNLAAQ
jgi:hypothetical protein